MPINPVGAAWPETMSGMVLYHLTPPVNCMESLPKSTGSLVLAIEVVSKPLR